MELPTMEPPDLTENQEDDPSRSLNHANLRRMGVVDDNAKNTPGMFMSPVSPQHSPISSQSQPKVNLIRIRQYPPNYPGPFVVYIRKLNSNSKLDIIKLNQLLITKYTSIEIIRPVSKNKVRIELTDVSEANKLPYENALSLFNVYIPAIKVECSGTIILSTDTDIDLLPQYGFGMFNDNRIQKVKNLRST